VFQGTLQQVIGQLANRYGLFWNYKKGKVNIFLLETKIYALDAPIGSFSTENTISSTSETASGSGGSGGATQSSSVSGSSEMNMKYSVKADSPWTAALTTLKDMLSPAGKIQGNPVEGYVAVTDNPDVQEKVADYIEKINKKTNQKIAVRVDVYDVQTSSTSDMGLDINAVASVLSSDEATFVTNSSSLLNQQLSDSMSSLTVSSSDAHGAILKALNTQGKTTLVTGATVYTVSGQPAPIQSVHETTYLASSSTTITQDSSQNSLEPGTVVTGYSMMVTPKLEGNNQVMITLNLQLSTLLGLETLTSGTGDNATSIQGPIVDSKNFLENMVLHSGQSLLIAGFQDDTGSAKTSSPGSTDYWFLGGGKSTQKVRTTTVIVVTPYIIGE
jgi:type IVB pilus formation R64 PilN family outer membrane protein